tara:strand:+ start:5132 stop:5413 length:282 start_codon:yes stop_codon:yes gene_type:complete
MFTIKREELFENEFGKIIENYSRVYDIESEIDWFLMRAYDNIKYVTELEQNKNHFVWRQGEVNDDFPQLIILYKVDYDKEMIHLLSVKKTEDE